MLLVWGQEVMGMGNGKVEKQKELTQGDQKALEDENLKTVEGQVDKVHTTLDKVLQHE